MSGVREGMADVVLSAPSLTTAELAYLLGKQHSVLKRYADKLEQRGRLSVSPYAEERRYSLPRDGWWKHEVYRLPRREVLRLVLSYAPSVRGPVVERLLAMLEGQLQEEFPETAAMMELLSGK